MVNGGFTLPGEAGFESLTFKLAERWGADAIRDNEGVTLSDGILDRGYCIYSTICPVREHNGWIRSHLNTRQQSFLCSAPKTAEGRTLSILPIDGFSRDQFEVNDSENAMKYWQVYDRTAGTEVPAEQWSYDAGTGEVLVQSAPWRQYTVSFLAWRIWEEISMYNHHTNGWAKERLMQLNPYIPEALDYLKGWFREWCLGHPHTSVVRFTSMYYNFSWIWGASGRNRSLFTDWASYDFTVCPEALDDFSEEYGYRLSAEDFVRGGKYNAAHRVPSRRLRDWMGFIGSFVRRSGRELVDVVHESGKLAYVFCDDNWVGIEPYNGHFEEFGFDGLIKCIFSGYEARFCAGVPVKTHEIRFHPYLFPVGLQGAPTFSPGGKPGADALEYWISVRRALLREKVDRCGLGGFIHLAAGYPDFLEAMDCILKEFRAISGLHEGGAPYNLGPKVAILHTWGKLRTWTLSGHFHETSGHTLVHVLESLSGLPFAVEFLSFDDIAQGVPEGVDIIINAGQAGDAWSGGACWADSRVAEALTGWVSGGGAFIGIGEPSALEGSHRFLRMAHVMGVDIDNGEYTCHGRWGFFVDEVPGLVPAGAEIAGKSGAMLTDGSARVLAEAGGAPAITSRRFGSGMGVYCAGHRHSALSARLLQNLILYAAGGDIAPDGVTGDPFVECAVYPGAGKLAMINNSDVARAAACSWRGKTYNADLKPHEMKIADI